MPCYIKNITFIKLIGSANVWFTLILVLCSAFANKRKLIEDYDKWGEAERRETEAEQKYTICCVSQVSFET